MVFANSSTQLSNKQRNQITRFCVINFKFLSFSLLLLLRMLLSFTILRMMTMLRYFSVESFPLMINRLLLILRLNIQHEKEMCEKCFSVFSILTYTHTHTRRIVRRCFVSAAPVILIFITKRCGLGWCDLSLAKKDEGIGYSNSPSYYCVVVFVFLLSCCIRDYFSDSQRIILSLLLRRKILIATNTVEDFIWIGEELCRL